jgi:thiol-disulfide isomerase/thioredoxin
MMDLSSPVFTWSKYTKELETKSKELTDISMEDAVLELRNFKRCIGEIPDCMDDQLKTKMVDCATSFDCSWSSRGWSARNGVVVAVSEDTGKVIDVVFMTSSCPHCKQMEDKRTRGETSIIEFLEWYIKHEPNCQLNHDGSAQVILYFMKFSGVKSKCFIRSAGILWNYACKIIRTFDLSLDLCFGIMKL